MNLLLSLISSRGATNQKSFFISSLTDDSGKDKKLIILGHISLLVTAILSFVFYRERVLYVDPGQQLFQMINENTFIIFNQRYSMAINQTIPLLFIKLDMPLRYIVIAYSMSFVVVYYLCYLVAVYGFKNIPAGVTIALAPIIIRVAFGHSISEAWLGVVYSAVFYAVLCDHERWKKKGRISVIIYYLILILTVALNYFIHPITFFTLAFAIGFNYFNTKAFRSPHIYVVSFLVLLMYSYTFFFPSDAHNESFLVGIKKADQYFPQLFHLPVIQHFLKAFLTTYIYPAILLLIVVAWYIKEKSLMKPTIVLFFCVVYLMVASLAFYAPDSDNGMESRLIPLIFFILIPLIEIIRGAKKGTMLVYILGVVLVCSYTSLVKLVEKNHTKRIALYTYMLKEVEKYPERKFYAKFPTDKNHAVNTWGSSTETLLLSSMEGKENSRTILFYDEKLFNVQGKPQWIKCLFMWVPWFMYLNEETRLNKQYFDLKCTTYREISYPENFRY